MNQTAALEKLDQILAAVPNLTEDSLADRLSTVLYGVDFAASGNPRSEHGVLWALTRVFGSYDRIAEVCERYSETQAQDLTFIAELEVEHFFLRLRVLLDEVAFAIRIHLKPQVRGLGRPEGPGPQKYFSINKFLKFVSEFPNHNVPLTDLINGARGDLERFIGLRDDIAHFRAKAIVFPGTHMSVGFVGSRASRDVKKIEHSDLSQEINQSVIWMWQFLQIDVVRYFRRLIEQGEIDFRSVGVAPVRIQMPGLRRFKNLMNDVARA